MRLYTQEEKIVPQFSQESFTQYYQTASVVAEEAISDFFYKLKDSLNTISNNLSITGQEAIVNDILSTRFELEHVIKRLKIVDLKDEYVPIPENFKGKYVEYIQDLITTSEIIVKDTESTLNHIKVAVSSFINEYNEEQVATLYGVVYFKDTDKLIQKRTKQISAYFPNNSGSVKAYLGDVLKTLNDIPEIHKGITSLESIINEKTIFNINKLAKEVAELIDLLIEQNKTSGVLLRNDSVKKDLVAALHITAREVEFMSYLYSNAIYFYSAYKSLAQLLLKKAN